MKEEPGDEVMTADVLGYVSPHVMPCELSEELNQAGRFGVRAAARRPGPGGSHRPPSYLRRPPP